MCVLESYTGLVQWQLLVDRTWTLNCYGTSPFASRSTGHEGPNVLRDKNELVRTLHASVERLISGGYKLQIPGTL